MPVQLPEPSPDTLLNQVFATTPLPFIQSFLRQQKEHNRRIRIGTTRKEVRANLRDSILSKAIDLAEVVNWYSTVEGWGKQHLYMLSLPRRSLTHAHLLTESSLRSFLTKKGFLDKPREEEEEIAPHIIEDIKVDDELASIAWRSHGVALERDKTRDEVRELPEGEFEFHAYRRSPKRSASRLIIRKTDGVVLYLIDLPLGEDHEALRKLLEEIAGKLLNPLWPRSIPLSPLVAALDQGAMERFGPRPSRQVAVGVAPTQARYRGEGAKIEFTSTRASTGYTDSDAVRHVRRALQISQFVGEAGKFRLSFEDGSRKAHDMIVSLHASEERVFLYSRMSETEVMALTDQFLRLSP